MTSWRYEFKKGKAPKQVSLRPNPNHCVYRDRLHPEDKFKCIEVYDLITGPIRNPSNELVEDHTTIRPVTTKSRPEKGGLCKYCQSSEEEYCEYCKREADIIALTDASNERRKIYKQYEYILNNIDRVARVGNKRDCAKDNKAMRDYQEAEKDKFLRKIPQTPQNCYCSCERHQVLDIPQDFHNPQSCYISVAPNVGGTWTTCHSMENCTDSNVGENPRNFKDFQDFTCYKLRMGDIINGRNCCLPSVINKGSTYYTKMTNQFQQRGKCGYLSCKCRECIGKKEIPCGSIDPSNPSIFQLCTSRCGPNKEEMQQDFIKDIRREYMRRMS